MMPAEQGLWGHNRPRVSPVAPVAEPDEGKADSLSGPPRLAVSLLIQRELLAEKEVFAASAALGGRQGRKKRPVSISSGSNGRGSWSSVWIQRRQRGIVGASLRIRSFHPRLLALIRAPTSRAVLPVFRVCCGELTR
jgi:hypothetical protein